MTKHRICPNFETLDTSKISDTTVILDVDGTITADGQSAFTAAVLATITELASRNIVYVFSNHRSNRRNRLVACNVGCALIDTPHRKPSVKILCGLPPVHRSLPLIVIGDKITVDGLFAWRVGARFIRVGRVRSAADRKLVKLAYLFDDLVAALILMLRSPKPRDAMLARSVSRDVGRQD